MSQSRFGGPAASSGVSKAEELGALMPPYSLDMPEQLPRRRRTSSYQIGAGVGAGAVGAGLLSSAARYTPSVANARATAAENQAFRDRMATQGAAARAANAPTGTRTQRRNARRANDEYRRRLTQSSSSTNAAIASRRYAQNVMGRRMKLAGAGAGLLGLGALGVTAGMHRRREGD